MCFRTMDLSAIRTKSSNFHFSRRSSLYRRLLRIRRRFKSLWKNYIYQSLFATLVVAIVILALTVQNAVVIASIGATAFIIFATPRNLTANPRRVIMGHIIGLISGSLMSLIPHQGIAFSILVYSLAVGVSIFFMVALDAEHPPASGTALGIAITGVSLDVVIAVLVSVVILSLAHRLLRRFLKDLV